MPAYVYSYGETFGPFKCKKCDSECWEIYTEKQYDSHEVIYKGKGRALCGIHRPEDIIPGGQSMAALAASSK